MSKNKYTEMISDMLFADSIAELSLNEDRTLEIQIGTFKLSLGRPDLDLSVYTVTLHNELVVRVKEAINALPKESADILYSFIEEKVSKAGVYSSKYVA